MSGTLNNQDLGGYDGDDEYASPLQSPPSFHDVFEKQNSDQNSPISSSRLMPSSTPYMLGRVTQVLTDLKHQSYRDHPSSESENATVFSSVCSWQNSSVSQDTSAQISPSKGNLPLSSNALTAMASAGEGIVQEGVNALSLDLGRPAKSMSAGMGTMIEAHAGASGRQYSPGNQMQAIAVSPLDPPAQIHISAQHFHPLPDHIDQDAGELEEAVTEADLEWWRIVMGYTPAEHQRIAAELALEHLMQMEADAGPGDDEGSMAGSGIAGDTMGKQTELGVAGEGTEHHGSVPHQVETGHVARDADDAIHPTFAPIPIPAANEAAEVHDDSQATAKRKAKTISWTTAERQAIIGADQEWEANERADRAARTVRIKRSKPADGSAQVELDQVPRNKKSERRALLKYEKFKWKSIVNKIRQFLPGRSDHQISLKGTALGLKETTTSDERLEKAAAKRAERLTKKQAANAARAAQSGGSGLGNANGIVYDMGER